MSNALEEPIQGWISARHVQHLVASGDNTGLPIDLLLEEAGLSRKDFANVDDHVSVAALERLLEVSAHYFSDPILGLHVAQEIQPATFGLLGYIAQACPRFSDVLAAVTRYNGLLSDIGDASISFAPGAVHLQWECLAGGPLFRRHVSEYILGAFVVLTRLLIPEQKSLFSAIHFRHEAPTQTRLLLDYQTFFQCPVYFSAPRSAVVMPASILKIALRHGDAFMKEMLERHALQQLEQRSKEHSIEEAVCQLMLAMLHDRLPDKEQIAAQLGMSSRSLHRKLQKAGTTYSELLDRVRLKVAYEHLDAEKTPLTEVAEALGFSTRQAFMRWFKGQTGETTTSYRERQQTPITE